MYRKQIRPVLPARKAVVRESAAEGLFGKVNDTIREAARMAGARQLRADVLAETCRAEMKEILGER
jgi:hypothetical protein